MNSLPFASSLLHGFQPVFAFTLVELIVLVVIIAIAIALFGPVIAALFKSSKRAPGGTDEAAAWQSPPATVTANAPTGFTLVVKIEKRDAAGTVLTTTTESMVKAFFDLKVTTGAGQIISSGVDGSQLPINKSASPGSPAKDVLGATDANGIITVMIQLEANSSATLVAHQLPEAAAKLKKEWTLPPISFSSN